MKAKRSRRLLVLITLLLASMPLLKIGCAGRVEEPAKWRALSELEPDVQGRVVEIARAFAGLTEVTHVTYPRVTSSHTRYAHVLGLDKDSVEVLVGVKPLTGEVMKMVRLCPRRIRDAEEVKITQEQAESKCLEFLKGKDVSVPDNYVLEEARISSLGPWKRWRFVWRHIEDGVRVPSDFVLMEVNAGEEANVITYSKSDHNILIGTKPALTVPEALEKAKAYMRELGTLELVDTTLAVIYPNRFFEKQTWEWSKEQALCWILTLGRAGRPVLDMWVDAMTGAVQGGEMFHLHAPEVFGIDSPGGTHMKSHLDNIWSPYLDMMKFDVTSFDWANTAAGISETAISGAISSGMYFVVEGHGDVTATAEQMTIAYAGGTDAQTLTPDEVPANNLRFALLDVCQSGEDGTGDDFKDTFIDQGGDVFIGFDDYMCAWNYEDRLLHYLAQGMHLANAHNLADADVCPWYKVVVTYDVACLNQVRLAPLLVTVGRSPLGLLGSGATFTVTASINNREDVDHTPATNVNAKLIIPEGFTLASGANPQNVGTVDWAAPKSAAWTVKAPSGSGLYVLDVEAWSDNLGVAVDDPGDPYHKFVVGVLSGGGCAH